MSGHKDSWGNTTEGCEVMRELGRVTWTLCGKAPVALGVYGDGQVRRMCESHRKGALRKRVFYSNEVVELQTLGGETTHTLRRESVGRRGALVAVPV
jgi:hypothetical protein